MAVWARLKFEELYVNNIKQLLFNFPLDMVREHDSSYVIYATFKTHETANGAVCMG